MAKFYLETPWDVAPTSASTYNIYPPEDVWIMGNAVDPLLKYDGDHDPENLKGNAPKGNILVVYKRRLMVAGNTDFPHRIFFSHLNNAEGWSRDVDWIDVYPEDGGIINSLEVVADTLIISKANSRKYAWKIFNDGNPLNSGLEIVDPDKGDVNNRSSTVLGDKNYFLDWEGLFTVPTTAKQGGNVSYPIKEVFDAMQASSRSVVALGSNDNKVYASIGDVTFNADQDITVTDTTAVLDVTNEAFYLRDNLSARVFTRFIDSGDQERLYFGSSDGKVFKMDTGTLAGLEPITMKVDTKAYFKEREKNVIITKIGVRMKDPDGTTVLARTMTEQDFVVQIGSVVEQPIEWFNVEEQVGEVPFIQLRFIHQSDPIRPALFGFIIVYKEAGRKEKDE